MKKLLILFLLLSSISVISQVDKFDNFLIKDVGYISIPNIMEIQKGEYKEYMDGFHEKYGKKFGYEIIDNRVVFQQKGLNEWSEQGFTTYARIILETNISNFGDFEKITTSFSATQAELSGLSEMYKSQLIQSFEGTTLKLIKWHGLATVTVNGRSAIKMSYLRDTKGRPEVEVSVYSFQNNDRMHSLTISYRKVDEKLWKPLMEEVLDSFVITNVR